MDRVADNIGHSYVLVSAAYNEERNIARMIESVLAQTIQPKAWVLVSDGSTDRTDDIIKSQTGMTPFIRFLRIEKSCAHSFGAKVRAINAGLALLKNVQYEYIGILDADISFQKDYFERLLGEFGRDPKLGICGGNIIQTVDGTIERRIKSLNSVAGAVQLFRRECFESTDGFMPIEYGGEDAAIEICARMRGWKVRTFPEIEVIHYGYVGQGSGGRIPARIKYGKMCYALGYSLLFEFFRLLLHIAERPFLVGSVAELYGFAKARRELKAPIVPPEAVKYLRREQLSRLFPFAAKWRREC